MSTNNEPGLVARATADPRLDHLRSGRARRRLSVLHAALSVAVVGFMAVSIPADWPVWLVVLGLAGLMAGWVWAMGGLNASINGLTELKDRDLDEVQRRVRDSAYRHAYRAAVGVVSVLAAAIVFGWLDGASATQSVLVGFAAFLLVLSLPAHLLAWRLPDDDVEV